LATLSCLPLRLILGLAAVDCVGRIRAQTVSLDPVLVSVSRSSADSSVRPVAEVSLDPADLQGFPAVSLDDLLRSDASFSLFRRTSSLSSNPTSQGVSLRGIGPSGASRSLVLLDSIPLNDPFGGWVQWSAVPRLALTQVELSHGGGSGVWGNAALAGTIQLSTASRPPSGGAAELEAGSFGTRSAEAAARATSAAASISADAADFTTDGFYAIAARARGAVDRPLSSRHQVAEVQASFVLSPAVAATVSARAFNEARGNGTVLTRNTTRTEVISAALKGSVSSRFGWSVATYGQSQRYSSVFSSVSPDRSTETPSNNQYAVPASAFGASATATWTEAHSLTLAGIDFRAVAGETREDFQYASGAFTRVRLAGGAQDFTGVFVHHEHTLLSALRLTVDARLDHWENRSGHDREYSLADGSPTLLALYPTRTGNAFSPDLGLTWQAEPALKLRANVNRAFRLPTLNEYYRPFRVGTVSTTANPNLVPETLAGAEAGFDYGTGPWTVSATGFLDDLRHGVGNIAIAQTATSTTVQRQNLDDTRIAGKPAKGVQVKFSYLLDNAHVAQALAQPQLDGLRLPEVPRHTLSASLEAPLVQAITAAARVRWVSLQFDDDLNTLRLPAATTVDLELSRPIGSHAVVYVASENLLNARVVTAESTAGLYSYDAPASVRGGVRLAW
jgi:outer membrane receptor protein involved in Fe transport